LHWSTVLADVVHVALDRGQHDATVAAAFAFALLRLDERDQISDRFFHHSRRFHHLRQEHFAGAEQVADHVHTVHQRAFDDV